MTKQELNNIIDQLHELGYTETSGKSARELKQQLAVMQIIAENPINSWF
ncbi:hypothetical protein [Oceanobacillus profundus]|nr:hypothetical protein [Oceanobacillus profundus]MDO6451737.1 hypothetical protein [Oceanobacillus profundus]